MIPWAELLKNRKAAPSVRNSAHMLECMKMVQEKYPTSRIVETSPKIWQLMNGAEPMSKPHKSHYACWAEAREVLNVANS